MKSIAGEAPIPVNRLKTLGDGSVRKRAGATPIEKLSMFAVVQPGPYIAPWSRTFKGLFKSVNRGLAG